MGGESSGVGASNIRQEAEIQTTNGESPKFTVQAWVSPKYHREIRLCPAETVATLAREIEKEFEREYGLEFQVLTLQDPNHNDIPMSPKCKASLVLRNSDRVFVVIRPESLTCNNGRKRGASWQSRDDAKHRKRRSVDACFRSYFALHAEVTKLEDAVRSVASGKSCTGDAASRAYENVVDRIRSAAESLSKGSPGATVANATDDEFIRTLDRLPHTYKRIFCRVGRSIAQDLGSAV